MLPRRAFLALPGLAARAQGSGTLQIEVTHAGRPTPARIYITDDSKRPHIVPGAITFTRRGESHSLIDGGASLTLPPGHYTIRAEKGTEFRPTEQSVTLTGAPAAVTLEVSRFIDMNAMNWYSGDLHLHRKPEEMPLASRAEHLNILPVITRHVGGDRPKPGPFPQSHVQPVDGTHVVTLQNQEVERLRAGHGAVLLLNTPEPVPVSVPLLGPLDLDFCRAGRRQGGFVDGEKPIWKNVPVNAAFGVLDAIGVVNNHFHPHGVMTEAESYGAMERTTERYRTPAGFAEWMMDLYYSLLNCGFRLPVSAGSASGVMPSWPGYERVYVNLTGPLSVEQWFRDLKAGRSMATNGPLLLVACDGKLPGTSTAWRPKMQVELKIDVRSANMIDRVEVIHNGKVIRTAPSAGGQIQVSITEPGWLAVRCIESVTDTVRYAHTSPFYFPVNGRQPAMKSEAAKWSQTIGRIAAEASPKDYPDQASYEKAQAVFSQARAIYDRL